jgi:hypothetical protein
MITLAEEKCFELVDIAPRILADYTAIVRNCYMEYPYP